MITSKPSNWITNRINYRRQYEYIFDMKDDTNLSYLSDITFDAKTTASRNSALDITIARLIANKAPEASGLNIIQLLDLPTDTFNSVLNAVRHLGMYEAEALAELQKNKP